MISIEQTTTETKNPLKALEDFKGMMESIKEYLPTSSYVIQKSTPWKAHY